MSFYHHFRKHHVPSAEFSPSDVSGLSVWLKADVGTYQEPAKSTPADDDGEAVGGWEDQSGVGYDFTQATAAKKAVYKTNIQNSLPSVRFDGTDDLLQSGAASALVTGDDPIYTLILAGKFISITNGDMLYSSASSLSAAPYIFAFSQVTATTKLLFAHRDDASGETTQQGSNNYDTSSHIYVLHGNGTTIKTYIDGTLDMNLSDDIGTKTINQVTLGCNAVESGEFNHGNADMFEVLMYDSALSNDDLNSVGDYLASRWNLTWNTVS
jgi:hypothetical protein